jgi:hypothetical protein
MISPARPPNIRTGSPVRGIATSYAATVGRIVIHWTIVELQLKFVAKRLERIGIKEARKRYKNCTTDELVKRIQVLAATRPGVVREDLKHFERLIRNAARTRHLVAHGPWLSAGKDLYIQNTRGGRYQVPGSRESLDMMDFPRGQRVTPKWLTGSLLAVKECRKIVHSLLKQTERLV